MNITDDDVPSVTVRYEQASYTVGEGSSVDVKVILSADPERSVTVPINKANQGGATDGDYSGVPANASVTFNSETEKSITFAATDDSVDDDGERALRLRRTNDTGDDDDDVVLLCFEHAAVHWVTGSARSSGAARGA